MAPLATKILIVLFSLQVYSEDIDAPEKNAQLRSIAQAIADVSDSPHEAALMLASGWEESGWSLRIHAGQCRPNECDHGRARGPWQVQRNGMSQESWEQMHGLSNTDAQARTVIKRLRFYQFRCGNTWGTIARYFGLPCQSAGAQVGRRFRTYRRFYDALVH